jgi:phenylpyruvate tautomerase PptA (4-oxalocrotonate tautomerase family)
MALKRCPTQIQGLVVAIFVHATPEWYCFPQDLSASVKTFPANLAHRQQPPRGRLRADLRAVLALGMLVLGALQLRSQAQLESGVKPGTNAAASSSATKVAGVKSFRIVQEKEGQAVEILSTKPLTPSIKALSDPVRLVIDLPNARLETEQKRISVEADQITTLRANQFQENPPVVRVVVDLVAPRTFTWDAAGNRLVVHLGKNTSEPGGPFEAPSVASLTPAPKPVVAAVRAAGPLALAESSGGAGSAITAGPDTAVLSLSSGGEVHVCPGTTVAVTPSQNRQNLMLSLNTGALEAHVALDTSSDTVMTPDFRILLMGPGEFHYAISADNQGNTCVRALPGNTAAAMVAELFGNRTYQVKATDQLVFRSGQIDRVDMAVPLECGCPPLREAPLRATNDLPGQSQALPLPPVNASGAGETAHAESAPSTGLPATTPAGPLDASAAPNEIHVQIEAPFVFRAAGPPPGPVEDAGKLPVDSRPGAAPDAAAPNPPPASESAKPAGSEAGKGDHPAARGFFRRLGGFLAALFR